MGKALWRGICAFAAGFTARDLMLFGGLVLIGYGASLIFWPAGFILPGAVLAAVSIFGVR